MSARTYGWKRDRNEQRRRAREAAAVERFATYRLMHPTRFAERKGQRVAERDLAAANRRRNAR